MANTNDKKGPRGKHQSGVNTEVTVQTPAARDTKSKGFWNSEYGGEESHLALSTEPSEDLEKFCRFLERDYGRQYLNPIASALDLGCGNGRNLIYLAKEYGLRGVGIDISEKAVQIARSNSAEINASADVSKDGVRKTRLAYIVDSINYSSERPLALTDHTQMPDASQTIVLDMMTSHFLNADERAALLKEIHRVLKPGGWLFFKTFFLEEDEHARRLIQDRPAEESNSYIHPKIGVAEHAFTEEEIVEALGNDFIIHKIHSSHKHREQTVKTRGLKSWQESKALKRRSISVYAQRAG